MQQTKTVKRNITRTGRLLGAYVPVPVVQGISEWVSRDPERDFSRFIREAAREKLRRDGVEFDEKAAGAGHTMTE